MQAERREPSHGPNAPGCDGCVSFVQDHIFWNGNVKRVMSPWVYRKPWSDPTKCSGDHSWTADVSAFDEVVLICTRRRPKLYGTLQIVTGNYSLVV